MKLAVVIPVFNHARYVAKALESVLGQTRRPDRIIVIDDGSTDDSAAVCRSFSDRGVEFHRQENQGAHETLNRLVAAADDCDVVGILNSDDHYVPDRLQKCLPLLADDASAAVVCSGLRYIDQDDLPLPDDHPRCRWLRAVWSRWGEDDLDLAEWMGQANFAVTTSNVIARRDFLLAHPFKPYRFNHDYYFLAQAAIRGRLRVTPEPLVNYRIHSANTINTSPAPLMRELLRQHLDLYHDLAPELGRDPDLRTRFFRHCRGSGDNVSALHQGLLQVLLARFLAAQSPEAIESAVADMDPTAWPELAAYPNKALVNSFDGSSPFTPAAGALADKFATARSERDDAKARAAALRDLARLRQRLLNSRWAAVGRTLGIAGNIDTDAGRTPAEKLAALRDAVGQSRWMRWGRFTAQTDPEDQSR